MNAAVRPSKETTSIGYESIGHESIGYEPGLDGLRALALLTILLFHAEISWAKGGFLSVSLFFTLSGYLITSLLLGEIDRAGRIDIRRFYARRVRRLAPASSMALLFVAATAGWYAAASHAVKLRGDVLAALGYVANWRFLLDQQSYAELFTSGPSPVLHFWSLAIEEQFYLVYPLLLGGAAWIGRRTGRRGVPEWALLALTAATVTMTLLNRDDDRAYYATHLRAPELLVGALAAVAVRRCGVGRLQRRPLRWNLLGGAGLVAFLTFVALVDKSAAWLHRGGFVALAVLWVALIVSVIVPGPMRRVFSTRPLTYLGQLTFGGYVFHWPIFLLVDEERTGLSMWPTFAIRVVVTLAVAAASHHFIEQPIRQRRVRLAAWRGAVAYVGAIAIVCTVSVVRLQPGNGSMTTFDQMLNAPDGVTHIGSGETASSTTETAPGLTVAVVGSDPIALASLQQVAVEADATVVDLIDRGCTMVDRAHTCLSPAVRYAQYRAAGGSADLVVLVAGSAEHDVVTARVTAAEAAGPDAVGPEFDAINGDMQYVQHLRDAVPTGIPIRVIDRLAAPDDSFSTMLELVVRSQVDCSMLAFGDVSPTLLRPASSVDTRARVLVLGDSTSYGVSVDVDRFGAGAYEVVWAGYRNCPIVPVTELRWFEGAQWTMEACVAAQQRWPSVIAEFRPDVVVVVESLPEHSEQRYPGDAGWHTSLDETFRDAHDTAVEQLLVLLAPYGAPLVIANSAPSMMSPAERVEAWNALLESWAARWPQVRVVDLASALVAAEAAAGHSLRPDNMHVDDATLELLVREVFLPGIEAALVK